MNLKHYIIVMLLFACHALTASENLCFDQYTTKNGICCDFILDIDQDKNGFIWIATKDGLSRFDGANFKNYSQKQGGLMENEVHCVHLSSQGELLIGSNNGMLQGYDPKNDNFTNRRFPELMDKYIKTVVQMAEDRNGKSYLLTTSGVFSFDTITNNFGKESFLSDSTYHLLVNAFYQDRNGHYWIGAFDGLHIYSEKGEQLGLYTPSTDNAPVSSILELDSANVLVATNMGGVWRFTVPEKGMPKSEKMNTPFKNISVMLKDSKGQVWLGTWGDGLWRMDNKGTFTEIKSYGHDDDLLKSHALFEDSGHNIWVGTQVNGLFRLQTDNTAKVLHSSETGYPKGDASCFIERPDGKIFVGSDGSGAFLVDADGKMIQSLPDFNVMGASLLSFCQAPNKNILVSSWFGGIAEVSPEGKVTPIKYEGLSNTINSSKCVRSMRNGEVWVATQGDGVYVRKIDNSWEKREFVVNDDVTDRWIDDMEEAPDGTKWLLSLEYIWRCDAKGLQHFTWSDSSDTADPCRFSDCVCDGQGNLFVATNYGIVLVEKESGKMTLLDYLPKSKFASVNIDQTGHLWCSGQAGIYRVNITEKTYKTIPLPTDKFGKLYFQPRAIYESSKGNMFFGCSNGFIMLNPSKLGVANAVDYLAWNRAESKMEDGKRLRFGLPEEVIKIAYDNLETHILFDAVSLTGPDVTCRYRLNEEETWHNLGNAREIVLGSLRPGKYNLELVAYKDGGEANAKTLTLEISVKRPWWLTWWFHTLSMLLIVGIGYIIYQKRKQQKAEVANRAQYSPHTEGASSDNTAEPEKPAVHPFIAQVFEVIERNYEDPDFSVEELAKELNTSKSTLIRKLKPLTEQTPVEMISEYRLKKADEMLRTLDLPVKEVAFKTGFSSPYYFSRKYKEFFGYPPSQIKEKE